MPDKIKIRIEGVSLNNYLFKLINIGINIYDYNEESNYIELIINKNDYEKLLSIKTSNKIVVKRLYGLSHIKYLLKKYRLLLVFSIISIIFVIILSNIIWNVTIINEDRKVVETTKIILDKYNLKKYKIVLPKNKLNKLKDTLNSNPLIEWAEIERVGTKYIVKVISNKKNTPPPTCLPRSIVARVPSTITRIDASVGEVVKEKNTYVEKGEVIISGEIHNKEDIKNLVCAKGKIYGNTWYKINVEEDIYKMKYHKTNKKRLGLYIRLFNKKYNLFNKYEFYNKKSFNLIESKIVPLNISIVRYDELKLTRKRRPMHVVEQNAIKHAIHSLPKTAVPHHKKILKKVLNNSRIDIEVFIEVEEDITDYKTLEKESE